MLLMKLGLMLAAVAAVLVTIGSWFAGYPAEIAILRGLVAWGGISFIAFTAEMVVVTTPRPTRARLDLSTHPPLEGDVSADKTADEQAA